MIQILQQNPPIVRREKARIMGKGPSGING